ncbi:hypothetical protein [Polaromonas sp. CG9_12]|nr:hypothetical protein [Polaromonas sp. CG9_12]
MASVKQQAGDGVEKKGGFLDPRFDPLLRQACLPAIAS